ncbi:MAG: DUF192 domain-containing protein [Deltaproteobacteria bacterium]|nr:DUF192 domain-containing protein [Deltaproteobacteria bacterium]
MFVHRHPSSVFAFLPWLAFWGQAGARLPDYAHLTTAVATDSKCKQVVKTFRTTLVRTPASRAKGLGGRNTPLAADEGMLFVFDHPERVSFWMKDTLIPLELALFDAKGMLNDLFEMPVEKDPNDPQRNYVATKPVLSALELAPSTLKSIETKKLVLCFETQVR